MKKSSIIKLLTFSFTCFLIASCSKSFTEKTPNDALPLSSALGNEAALSNALNGMYASLRSYFLYGRDIPVVGDLLADNTFVESKNSNRYLSQSAYNFIAADAVFGEIWSKAYNGILLANQIIDAPATGGTVPQIKAQAKAVRALLYFRLVNVYARPYTDNPSSLGVPLVLNYDPNRLPTRSTVGDVYNQIVSDLKSAFADAPDYESSIALSKYAIGGILAKVYLYMADNAKAKAAAVDVINNGGFTLATPTDYANYWGDPSVRTDAVETLFEVDADDIDNNGTNDLGAIYLPGYQDIYATMPLYNLYSTTDVRTSVMLQGVTKRNIPAILVTKYPNANNADRDNLKVIRLAEVYLIAAEASLPGNENDARTYLNDLMAQRDPTFPGYTSSGTALLDDIVQERRKELAFEGDRFYDLNRLKRNITRVVNAGGYTPGNNVLTIDYTDIRRIGPIPQTEIQANPNIASQQNPGY